MPRDLVSRIQRLEREFHPDERGAWAFIIGGGKSPDHSDMDASEAHDFIRSYGHDADARDTVVWMFNFGEPLHLVAAYPVVQRHAA